MSWDLLIVSPPRGDKDQAVGANPDLEEHAAPVAQDGHQAGVLLQRVPEPHQHAQLIGKPGGGNGLWHPAAVAESSQTDSLGQKNESRHKRTQ